MIFFALFRNEFASANEQNSKPTVCPCPNQPAEKVTAPRSKTCSAFLGRKFCPLILQFGAVLLGTSSFTVLLSIGLMLTVAAQMLDYFEWFRWSKINEA
jgi:hypothetical protein